MSSPLVSIVMAAYNEGKYIHEAIESVLSQTYTNFEFIIINDGSTDNTEKIIFSFSDARIKYVKNEANLKLIESLNKGLHIATGKYIARMDADDICFPNRLETQVQYMESNPSIGLSGAQLTVFGNTNGTMSYPLSHEDIKLQLFITSTFGNNVVIFRKDIMEQHQLYFSKGYYHAEDYKCWTNWVKYTHVANLNTHLVKYRSHAGSVSIKNRLIQRQTRNKIRLEYLTETFKLNNDNPIAVNFIGKISLKRIEAIKYILHENKKSNQFSSDKLEKMICDLWYADCLEKVEEEFAVIFKFPFIFKLNFKNNLVRWWYLLKHFVKLNLVKPK